MFKRPFALTLLLMLAVLAGGPVAATGTSGREFQPRVVKLEFTGTPGPGAPHGVLTVHPYEPPGHDTPVWSQNERDFVELQVSNLNCLRIDSFWTLYMITPSTGRVRVLSFNTSCTGGKFHTDVQVINGLCAIHPSSCPGYPFGANRKALFTEPLVVEITSDQDDGVIPNPNINVPRLRGED